jgi:membrane associated rhomboid family serine protease
VNQFQSWYNRQPPALRTIITINVGVYVLSQFLLALAPGIYTFARAHLALHPVFPDLLFEPWQLVTYNFLHMGRDFGGLLHIAFNMLWLFWIGKEYEEMHGSQRMWTLYLAAGIGGGLMCALLSPIAPGIAGGGPADIPVYGASASVLGVIMAVAILYPYKQIGLLFFGVVRLLYVVVGFLIIDALLALTSTGTAVAAHWGGALSGYLFAKNERGSLPIVGSLFGTKKRSRRGGTENLGLLDRLERWLGGGDDQETEPARSTRTSTKPSSTSDGTSTPSDAEQEVDRILDKISEHGYEALSDDEKRTLYEASQS